MTFVTGFILGFAACFGVLCILTTLKSGDSENEQ